MSSAREAIVPFPVQRSKGVGGGAVLSLAALAGAPPGHTPFCQVKEKSPVAEPPRSAAR